MCLLIKSSLQSSRNMYKGHTDEGKGGRMEGGGREAGMGGGEMETTVLEQ